jgi:hypothetical protein
MTSNVSPMTLLDLRRQLRVGLASVEDWPDSALDRWVQDALRFYAVEFPRRWRHTLTLETGTQAYALPGGHGLQTLLAVEYPAGETPPRFVTRVDEWDATFGAGLGVYAVRGVEDDTAIDADVAVGSIVFAETVTTGETAALEYLGGYPLPAIGDNDAVIAVPEAHLEALIAFVDFRAHWALETGEAVTLTTVSIILSQLGQEARLAWRRYKEVVERLQALAPLQNGRVVWSEIGL